MPHNFNLCRSPQHARRDGARRDIITARAAAAAAAAAVAGCCCWLAGLRLVLLVLPLGSSRLGWLAMDGAAAARQRVRASRRAKKQPLGALGLNAGESTSIVDKLAREAVASAHRQQHTKRLGADARGSARGSTVFGNSATRRADLRRQLAREADAEAVSVALGDAPTSSTWMSTAHQRKGRDGSNRALGMYPGRKVPAVVAARRIPARGSRQGSRRRQHADPFSVLTSALQAAVLAHLPRSCLLAASQTCRRGRVAGLSALAHRAAMAESRLAQQRANERSASAPGSSLRSMPQDDCCPICLSEVEDAASCVQLQCGHGYHAECIESWLKLHSTCPVCRKDASGDSGGMSIGLLEAARLSTQEVSRAELVELRMGKRPAGVLLGVFAAVLTVLSNGAVDLPQVPLRSLLSSKPDAEGWRLWKRGQACLQDVDHFLASLLDLEPLSLSPSTLQKLLPFVESDELSPLNIDKPINVANMNGSSQLAQRLNAPPPHTHVAATLCRWFRAIYSCATTPSVRDQLLQKEHSRAAQAHKRWSELAACWEKSTGERLIDVSEDDSAKLVVEVDADAGYAQFVPAIARAQVATIGELSRQVDIPSAVVSEDASQPVQQQQYQNTCVSAAEMRRQRLARFDPTEPRPEQQHLQGPVNIESVSAGILGLSIDSGTDAAGDIQLSASHNRGRSGFRLHR